MVIGNQHKILLGLAFLLVALLTYRILNPYRQETVARLTYGRATKITPTAPQAAHGRDAQRPTTVMTALFQNPPPAWSPRCTAILSAKPLSLPSSGFPKP